MRIRWDYTDLAETFEKRPDYSDEAVNAILDRAELQKAGTACDVGAGAAHLTIKLAERGLDVTAIEPNLAMRRIGIRRTRDLENVEWYEGTGESTGMPDASFDLVTFGHFMKGAEVEDYERWIELALKHNPETRFYIQDLWPWTRDLFDPEPAQHLPHPGQSVVVCRCESGSAAVSVHHHRPELVEGEQPASEAHPLLPEDRWAW